jgi:hypothetical protein
MGRDGRPEPAARGESTIEYAEQVDTVDLLGPKAREARELRPGEEGSEAAPALDTKRLKIGRYQLLEMAGAGGMGLVWGAWDPELERCVALNACRS